MSGRPFLQDLNRKIEAAGGDDVVFDRLAAGESVSKIAESFGVSRPYMYVWRKQGPPELAEERRRRWEEAMLESAEAHLDRGLDIVDELAGQPVTPAIVSAANSRANYRKELAAMRDPRFSTKGAVNVQVNLGVAHLDVLRRRSAERQLITAEVIEEDPVQELLDDGE